MSTSDNTTLARRMFEEVWGGGNLNAIDDICSPDCVVHFNAGDVNGAADYKEEIGRNRVHFPDLHFTVTHAVAEGEHVALRCAYSATYQGGGDTMPTTAIGKRFAVAGMALLRFADGRCEEVWINSDRLGVLQQLGAVPA